MTADTKLKTALSIHSDWDISKQEQYVYQFHLYQLPELKENQISITGFKLEEYDDFFTITGFIRSTVPQPIKFEMLQLLLLDEEQQVVARETFDMERFGELPSMSARPWRFIFDHDSLIDGKTVPSSGWTIAFELKSRNEHKLDLDESWKNSISQEQTAKLQQLVQNIEPVKPNEVNIMGLEALLTEQKDLHVTLLIRNGSMKNIQLEQLPLVVEDATGEIIARGAFQTAGLEVNANTSKPWTFIFPKELLNKEEIDLSAWKVYPPSNN
ncbi:accessory Sec system S-layer assembly protein [Metabacillus sp. RGM 3146]|uniref:accessory Sec system S-layer assembly protein n=1 Tax=Metabacillus sp. RGM 3146 TaxID=3401092 RepID=UPI003B98E873